MTSSNARANAIESVETAMDHLAVALAELDRLRAGDGSATGLVAHALSNCVTVADATVGLLSEALRDHPNPEVATWLRGLSHVGDLMHHTIGRLAHTSPPADFPLALEPIDLPALMRRVAEYHRPKARSRQLTIVCTTVGDIPPAWGDRVAVAVVADNLLSNVIRQSHPAGSITVQILPGPGGVVCRVRDHGEVETGAEDAESDPAPSVKPAALDPSYGYALTIVKELVQRMGGRVWYENDAGSGISLAFSLPYPPSRLASSA